MAVDSLNGCRFMDCEIEAIEFRLDMSLDTDLVKCLSSSDEAFIVNSSKIKVYLGV